MTKKVLPAAWLLVSVALFFYSYGFVDFNLTLTSEPHVLATISYLQHIVYLRPLSAQIFGILAAVSFMLYVWSLRHAASQKLTHFPWRAVITLLIVLSLAYPMLSYDVFNYMFHTKILWLYHQNPHIHAPLEYQQDLWLRFMRWVHTPSAYGPVFTAIESPAYLLGIGKFIPVLYLMKLTMTAFFVWCIYLVGRIGIAMNMSKNSVVLSQLMLALNPFLLLELVVTSHNDAVMMALFLLALLYAIERKRAPSLLTLLASVGVKYVTVLAVPALLLRNHRTKIIATVVLLFLPVLLSPGRFQPWYLTWILIPAVLMTQSWAKYWYFLASASGLLYYIPYIRTGFWVNTIAFNAKILYTPIILAGIYTVLCWSMHKKKV